MTHVVATRPDLAAALAAVDPASRRAVVMTMGAGSIGTNAQKVVQASSGGAHVV